MYSGVIASVVHLVSSKATIVSKCTATRRGEQLALRRCYKIVNNSSTEAIGLPPITTQRKSSTVVANLGHTRFD